MQFNKPCVTLTFGEQVENHVGMQTIGQLAENGLTIHHLKTIKKHFQKMNIQCQWINLNDALPLALQTKAKKAVVLVVRNGLNAILAEIGKNSKDMLNEQLQLNWDTFARMYNRVVRKTARYNLCYADEPQEPNYPEGRGRVVAFQTVPYTHYVKQWFTRLLADLNVDLKAEGNMYYDTKQCGIGFHGDSERKIVIAVRLGQTMSLHYRWFFKNKIVGDRVKLKLADGDIYLMSEKATGNDWKKRNLLTLRHAAGAVKYTTPKNKSICSTH